MTLEDFQKEFLYVYEWTDAPETVYPEHAHKGKVSIYVLNGEVTFFFPQTNETKIISAGQRFDVPVRVSHSAKVGKEGCNYIVGEMIKGDS
jgi:quercetin dioxygenase-like cupin family protein